MEPPSTCEAPPAPRATVFVCVLCGRDPADKAAPPAGRALYEALAAEREASADTRFHIEPAQCLSNCNRGLTVAGPDRWTYMFGELTIEDAPSIYRGCAANAETEDGLVPWNERPACFRRALIARVPPLPERSL
jgi:predicted metal-binding protein